MALPQRNDLIDEIRCVEGLLAWAEAHRDEEGMEAECERLYAELMRLERVLR